MVRTAEKSTERETNVLLSRTRSEVGNNKKIDQSTASVGPSAKRTGNLRAAADLDSTQDLVMRDATGAGDDEKGLRRSCCFWKGRGGVAWRRNQSPYRLEWQLIV